MQRDSCGSCSLCCDLVAVTALAKPECQLCRHAEPGRPGGACTIYEARPEECRTFRCVWLISQEDEDKTPLPIELRPDNCHVVFAGVELNGEPYDDATAAHVDPKYPNAWREGPVYSFINKLVDKGVLVALRRGDNMAILRKKEAK